MRHAAQVLSRLSSIAAGVPARADVVLSGPDTNDGGYSTAQLQNIAMLGDTYSSGGLTGVSP